MAKEITGPLRDWLAAQRDTLNARFRFAQRRYPSLDSAAVLDLVAEILPPLAQDAKTRHEHVPELLLSVYDLILLHAGRGFLGGRNAPAAAEQTFAGVLLRQTFPALAPLLCERPRALTGALSNAAENLGERGTVFARQIADLGSLLGEPEQLLDAGVVLAWRLGEPRLRNEAFIAAAKLPAQAALQALGLTGWPDSAAVLVLTALQADGWRAPKSLFKQRTLSELHKLDAKNLETLRRKLAKPPLDLAPAWSQTALVGNFSGFGGHFDEPPLLVGRNMLGNRHRLWVLSTEGFFRIDADVFGWVCQPDPSVDLPVQEVRPRPSKLGALLKGKTDSPQLYPDGRLESVGYQASVPEGVGAATFACGPALLALTQADSFRVRVLTPAWEPL